jgi:hypothetical protein
MARPFSRLGERGGNALAGTVAGIVKIQNATAASTAATTAPMVTRLIKEHPAKRDVFLYEPRRRRDDLMYL